MSKQVSAYGIESGAAMLMDCGHPDKATAGEKRVAAGYVRQRASRSSAVSMSAVEAQ